MRWTVFIDTLKHSWVTTLLWSVGLGAVMAFIMMLIPAMNGLNLVALFESLPPAMLAAAGVSDVNVLATPEGLVALGFFGKLALVFAAYPVIMGLNAITNEEANGTMDVILSLPVARQRVVVEKFLAYSINIIVMVVIIVGGLLLGYSTLSLEMNINSLIVLTLSSIPLMIFILGTTIFVGAFISDRRTVIIIMTAFVMGSYMLQTIGLMIDSQWMNPIEAFSFFNYYNIEAILKNGFMIPHLVGLAITSLILLGASLFSFDRRDILA